MVIYINKMRNVFIPLVLCMAVYSAKAQSTESDLTKATTSVPEVVVTSSAIEKTPTIRGPIKRTANSLYRPKSEDKNYAVAELEVMSKMQLTGIYLDQISKLNLLLPFIAFDQEDKLSPKELIGEKIPQGRSNFTSLEKIKEQTLSINKLYEEELASLLPYSDKADMIRSIVFLQKSVKAISEGSY